MRNFLVKIAFALVLICSVNFAFSIKSDAAENSPCRSVKRAWPTTDFYFVNNSVLTFNTITVSGLDYTGVNPVSASIYNLLGGTSAVLQPTGYVQDITITLQTTYSTYKTVEVYDASDNLIYSQEHYGKTLSFKVPEGFDSDFDNLTIIIN